LRGYGAGLIVVANVKMFWSVCSLAAGGVIGRGWPLTEII